MNNSQKTFLGYFFAVITIFIWGITFVSSKYLLQSFSALEILFVRFIFAYLGLWMIKPKTLHLEKFKDNIWFLFAGLSGVTLYQFAENSAISYTTASNVSIIVSICPMFTALFAQIFLKEKHLTAFFNIGFIIAIVGITLVSLNGHATLHLSPRGDLLALLAAVCWGFYSLFVSHINGLKLDPVLSTRRIFFFALICMIPLVLYGRIFSAPGSSYFVDFSLEQNSVRFSNIFNWLNLLFLGIGASAFCFVAWNFACSTIGTVKITGGIYLIPVVTVVFAWIFIGEKISFMGFVGCLITITGLFISNIKKEKQQL